MEKGQEGLDQNGTQTQKSLEIKSKGKNLTKTIQLGKLKPEKVKNYLISLPIRILKKT